MASPPDNEIPRSLLGYSRDEVESRLAAERERLRRAEAEAERLGTKLDDRERRLKTALEELEKTRREAAEKGRVRSRLDELKPPPPDPLEEDQGVGRLLEEIYAEFWRAAGKLGERAARDTVRIAGRGLIGRRFRQTLGGAEIPRDEPAASDAGFGRRPAASGARADGLFEGEIEVEIGPLKDFAQLSGFEDAANAIGATGQIKVKQFAGGRATLAVDLERPCDLLRELEERAALDFHVRDTSDGRVVLDVDEDDSAAA